MALARYEGTAVDTAGNVIPNATVEVRRDQAGRPVVPLWADREGTVALGNPIQTDAQGGFAFHVVGGVYFIRIYTGPSQQPTFQKVLRYKGIGTAAERDVEELASALEAGTATFPTLPELEAFTPSDVGVGGKVTTGEDAGFYHYDTVEGEWVFDRPLYDTLARMNVTGGSADAIIAETAAGVADSAVVMLWIEAPGDNTGPVTINGKEVLTATGNSLIAGQWNEGRTYWFSDEGANYKLRTESDVDGIATQVEIWANETLANKNYAEEWAQSDDPIGVEAGGDGINDKSSKAWAGVSADSAAEAAGYAAGVNLPAIALGDVGKQLFVNEDEDGYELRDPPEPITDGDKGDVIVSAGATVWTVPRLEEISPQSELPSLNGRVGNIYQITKAIRNKAAKVVIVGDSIAEGLSQTSYGDSFFGLLTDHLRQNIGGVAWTFENYSIAGLGVGDYQNAAYNAVHAAGPAMSPPNYQLFPAGDSPPKAWRDYAKDAAPDLLIIAFGMNANSDDGAAASAMNAIITYIETFTKIPSILLVTPMLPARAGGGSPYQYVQAQADAWRGIAAQRNVSLADANAIYRLLLDGIDIQRTPKRRRTFSNFSNWITVTGTRPSVAGSTMTFAATGWVANPDVVENFDVTAVFNMDGTDICDLSYRYQDSSIATNDGYIVRVSHSGGGSTVDWYGPGNTLLHSQGTAAAASYEVHVECIGARHRIWVNDAALTLPNMGLHYAQLYPGRVGLAFAQGAGTVTSFDARLGSAKVYTAARYTEEDLLGVNDWATNLDSIGGNAINHPSVIASLLVYFASFKVFLDALQDAAQAQLPMFVRAATAEIATSFVANDYIDVTVAGIGPAQISYMGGVSPNQFGASSNVQLVSGSSVVINGRKNGTTFVTHTITFPHAGNWLVYSTLTASTSSSGVRHALTSYAIEVQ